jgi:hypothetical protein
MLLADGLGDTRRLGAGPCRRMLGSGGGGGDGCGGAWAAEIVEVLRGPGNVTIAVGEMHLPSRKPEGSQGVDPAGTNEPCAFARCCLLRMWITKETSKKNTRQSTKNKRKNTTPLECPDGCCTLHAAHDGVGALYAACHLLDPCADAGASGLAFFVWARTRH